MAETSLEKSLREITVGDSLIIDYKIIGPNNEGVWTAHKSQVETVTIGRGPQRVYYTSQFRLSLK